ncbi:general stress protein [Corynebacterium pacaense]|uniref:general stress protein n=1 Tax=Corynebacterium pacaense TaxID=1816684 RepID=UPI0009BB05F0|nr:general stress protein [Corynebacterium pacaense]
MTTPSRAAGPERNLNRNTKTRPEGWPVGSFQSYAEAQSAVDMLSDREFPVSELTIVGVDLMEVEKVTGRLTWGRVIAGGAASGAWLGLFFGLLMSFFYESWGAALLVGVTMGVVFGIITTAIPYAASRGRRDFTSSTQIVAGRYDVLCTADRAREARDLIARSEMGQRTPE